MVDPPPYSSVDNLADGSYDVIDETEKPCAQLDIKQPANNIAAMKEVTIEQTMRNIVREELERAFKEQKDLESANAKLRKDTAKTSNRRIFVVFLFVLALIAGDSYRTTPTIRYNPLTSNEDQYSSTTNPSSTPAPSFTSTSAAVTSSTSESVRTVPGDDSIPFALPPNPSIISSSTVSTSTVTPSSTSLSVSSSSVAIRRTHEVFHGAASYSAQHIGPHVSTNIAIAMAGHHCIKTARGANYLRAWRGPLNHVIRGELRADLAPHCRYNEQWIIEENEGKVLLHTRFDGLHFYLYALPNGQIDFLPMTEENKPLALWTPVKRSIMYWSLKSAYGTYLSTIPSDDLQNESVDAYDLFLLEDW